MILAMTYDYIYRAEFGCKLNPKNWKISIENWFENIIKVNLDYSKKSYHKGFGRQKYNYI